MTKASQVGAVFEDCPFRPGKEPLLLKSLVAMRAAFMAKEVSPEAGKAGFRGKAGQRYGAPLSFEGVFSARLSGNLLVRMSSLNDTWRLNFMAFL